MISVRTASPHEPGATALLRASHAYLAGLYAAKDNHYLSIVALAVPEITFLVAEDVEATMGCAALAHKAGYGEIKSMFVSPDARGTGTGAALLAALEQVARDAGLGALRLETGDTLYPAHRLYARHGFAICGRFGDYADGPHSIFMEKLL